MRNHNFHFAVLFGSRNKGHANITGFTVYANLQKRTSEALRINERGFYNRLPSLKVPKETQRFPCQPQSKNNSANSKRNYFISDSKRKLKSPTSNEFTLKLLYFTSAAFAFSTLTLLVGQQEGHPVCKKTERWGAGVVICLERGSDLHMARLMPLPLTVSCFHKIQIGFSFLVPAHLGSPGQMTVKWVCVLQLLQNPAT